MKHYEDSEQKAFFAWAGYYPELVWMFSINNGGNRNLMEAIRLKNQGTKAGVYDIFLPLARHGFHGLFIEMKRKKSDGSSRISKNQKLFGDDVTKNQFKCCVCYGSEEAITVVKEYINLKRII